jgi:elongation factor P--beta-lysine ligase
MNGKPDFFLVKIRFRFIKKLLKTDTDLWFLLESPENDLKNLVACIRGRLYQLGTM